MCDDYVADDAVAAGYLGIARQLGECLEVIRVQLVTGACICLNVYGFDTF